MKVMPSQLPPPASVRPSAPVAPVQSFDLLLDKAGEERAFGFCELGVFGASRSTAAPATRPVLPRASPVLERPAAEQVMRPQLASPLTIGDRTAIVALGRTPISHYRSPLVGPASKSPAADAQVQAGAVVGEAPVAAQAPGAPIDGEPGPVQALSRALLAALGARAGSVGRVTLAPEGQSVGVHIVISAPDLTPRETRDLRRAAARMTALHGFTLGRLTLNGAELDPLALD